MLIFGFRFAHHGVIVQKAGTLSNPCVYTSPFCGGDGAKSRLDDNNDDDDGGGEMVVLQYYYY